MSLLRERSAQRTHAHVHLFIHPNIGKVSHTTSLFKSPSPARLAASLLPTCSRHACCMSTARRLGGTTTSGGAKDAILQSGVCVCVCVCVCVYVCVRMCVRVCV